MTAVHRVVRPYGDLVHVGPYEWDRPVQIIGDAAELRAFLAAAEQ